MTVVIRNAARKAAMVFTGFAILGTTVCLVLLLMVSIIPGIDTSTVPIYLSILVTTILLIIALVLNNFQKGEEISITQ